MTSRRALVFISVLMMVAQPCWTLLVLAGTKSGASHEPLDPLAVGKLFGIASSVAIWGLLAWKQWHTDGAWSLGVGIYAIVCLTLRAIFLVSLVVRLGISALEVTTVHQFLTISVGALGLLTACSFALFFGRKDSAKHPSG